VDPGVFFAVVAALVGGVKISLVKSYLGERPAVVVAAVVSLLGLVWYVPLVGLLAPGDATVRFDGLSWAAWATVAGGIATGGLGTVLFFSALRTGEASYVAPLGKTVPLFVLPIELALLPVSLRGVNLVGVGVITGGVYVANYRDRVLEPLVRLASVPAARRSLASAACFGVFDVIQRTLLQEVGLSTTTWVVLNRGGVGLALLAWTLVRGSPRRGFGDVAPFLLVGALDSLMLFFSVRAFALLPASIASPVINAQSVAAVVLGGVVLNERHLGRRLLAVALIVGGVGMVSV
jgi:drug/metabolite transporter (DMT)-like permease